MSGRVTDEAAQAFIEEFNRGNRTNYIYGNVDRAAVKRSLEAAAPHMREGEAVPAAHVMVNRHGQMVELRYNTGHGYNFTVADFLHADQVLPDGAPHTGRLLYTAPPKADAVDLEQFRVAVRGLEIAGNFQRDPVAKKQMHDEAERLRAIIDISRSKP